MSYEKYREAMDSAHQLTSFKGLTSMDVATVRLWLDIAALELNDPKSERGDAFHCSPGGDALPKEGVCFYCSCPQSKHDSTSGCLRCACLAGMFAI